MLIMNSTIYGNMALDAVFGGFNIGYGGGVYSQNALTILHSTVANNSAAIGGGIRNFSSALVMHHSIVANNVADDLYGSITQSGHNLIGNSTGGSGYVSTDLVDIDPLLGPLTANGGPTLSMALLPGSPAIDSGDNTDAPSWDQRGPGFPRIVNGTIDRGAFEVQATGIPSTNNLAVLLTADFGDD
jgi:hypothetical protein